MAFACINIYTDLVLTIMPLFWSREIRHWSYDGLVHAVLGRRAAALATISIMLGSVGALSGFLIIVSDLAVPVFQESFGSDSLAAQRWLVIIVFGSVLAVPLSFVGKIHKLAFSSCLGVTTVVAVMFVVVYRGACPPPCAGPFEGGRRQTHPHRTR